MDMPYDPAGMAPEERLEQIAAILARGVLRCRKRVILSPSVSEKPAQFYRKGLEVSGPSRLSVPAG